MTYEKTSILSTLTRIDSGELVLPAIQRDFVWEPERMYKLLDSIFRGYPFSTMLFWNTKQRLQYRQFTKAWEENVRYTFQIKEEGKKGTMVLDGQQRLQTMYLALYGSYQQKILFFDLLSGEDHHDDVSEARYHFEYLSPLEAEEQNKSFSGEQYWVPLRDLKNLTFDQLVGRTLLYLQQGGTAADSPAGKRLGDNLGLAYGRLKGDEDINFFTVDKEFGEDGIVTGLDEILEIFVRVNSGGQTLSKSDLMFSLMQMLWEGASDAITDLIDELNRKGRYDFDKDFILKCALVCCGKGAKYEVKKLRDEKTVTAIRKEFPKIALALHNFMEFLINEAKLLDDRILRSYNTLIPFVYFYYKQPDQIATGEETLLRMKRGLYFALMARFYSRYADNYIDLTTHNIFDASLAEHPEEFPLESFTRLIYEKTGFQEFNDGLLQSNLMLLMNILEGGRRLPEGTIARPPEIDHIFPKSKLEELGFPEEERNNFANFRLIPPKDNNWKRAQDPAPYFEKNPGALRYYLIPDDSLDYSLFHDFLRKRRAAIWEKFNQFFGLDGIEETTIDPPVIILQNTHQVEIGSLFRQECETALTSEESNHPIMKDNAAWSEVFKKSGITPQWSGVYAWALKTAGIDCVSDFAAAIMALGLEPNGWSSGKERFQFRKPLLNGEKVNVVTKHFGGWAWYKALEAMAERGLDWQKYLVK